MLKNRVQGFEGQSKIIIEKEYCETKGVKKWKNLEGLTDYPRIFSAS
jgi:hypothetical protein